MKTERGPVKTEGDPSRPKGTRQDRRGPVKTEGDPSRSRRPVKERRGPVKERRGPVKERRGPVKDLNSERSEGDPSRDLSTEGDS